MKMSGKKVFTLFVVLVLAVLLLCTMLVSLLGESDDPQVYAATRVWDGSLAGGFEGGIGTASDPYQISTAEQLAYFAAQVNAGTSYSGQYVKLTADIFLNDETFTFDPDTGLVTVTNGDKIAYLGTGVKGDESGANAYFDGIASTAGGVYESNENNTAGGTYGDTLNAWTTIGKFGNGTTDYPFSGTFDGDGHTVSGVYINKIGVEQSEEFAQGLFSIISGTAPVVKNVGVINSYVKGVQHIGGIVGINDENATLQNCFNRGFIVGGNSIYGNIGGVVGLNDGNSIVTDCYNTGTVFGYDNVGGVVGQGATASITDSYNTGMVFGNENVGGVIGLNNNGDIAVKNCYNTGSVSGSTNVGGVSGTLFGELIAANNYNTGKVFGTTNVGGVSGYVKGSGTSHAVALNNSYNVGTVSTFDAYCGGVVGRKDTNATVNNCYYLTDCATDGSRTPQKGIGNSTSASTTADVSGSTNAFSSEGKISTATTITIAKESSSATNYTVVNDASLLSALNGWITTRTTPSSYSLWSADGNYAKFSIIKDGSGTASDPYQISTAEQLACLSYFVASGITYSGEYIKLTADIVLNDTSDLSNWATSAPDNVWTPIGSSAVKFNGTFDGDGHTVSGLYINNPTGTHQGLFGFISGSATINNVGVIDSYIYANKYVGGVVGFSSSSTVINCYNAGTISGDTVNSYYIGGVVGNISGVSGATSTVENCYNAGVVSGYQKVGGVVGSGTNANATVKNCFNVGAVSGTTNIGGVVGDGTTDNGNTSNPTYYIKNCYYLTGSAPAGNGKSADVDTALNAFSATGTLANGYNYVGETKLLGALKAWVRTSQTNSTKYRSWAQDGNYAKFLPPVYFAGGDGSESAPYLISNAEQLNLLSEVINSKNGTVGTTTYFGTTYVISSMRTAYYKLTDNIVLNDETFTFDETTGAVKVTDDTNTAYLGIGINGTEYNKTTALSLGTWYSDAQNATTGDYTGQLIGWTPIGSSSWSFKGTFLGENHTVSGIYCNKGGNDVANAGYQGLFGTVEGASAESSAMINIVGVVNSYIRGVSLIGGVVGFAEYTKVTGCSNDATVLGTSSIGGIVGKSGEHMETISEVTSCHNTGIVSGKRYVGGVVGDNHGKDATNYSVVRSCYNEGKVISTTDTDASRVGGVVGWSYNYTKTIDSYNTGAVTGYGTVTGGVVGENNSNSDTINCYNTGKVTGYGYEIGGVVGSNSVGCKIVNCYNTGDVSSAATSCIKVGGVVGINSTSEVINCYYREGCAQDGSGKVQNGIGNETLGSVTDDGDISNPDFDCLAFTMNDGAASAVFGEKKGYGGLTRLVNALNNKVVALADDTMKKWATVGTGVVHSDETPAVTYCVTYVENDGSTVADDDYATGTNVTLPTGRDITKNEYTFLGWTATNDATDTTYIKAATINGHKTFYAKWAQFVYFDPIGGNDANDGLSAATALQTFDQAKARAAELSVSTIFIISTWEITATADTAIDGDGITLKRGYNAAFDAFTGVLVAVLDSGFTVTFTDITIDGGASFTYNGSPVTDLDSSKTGSSYNNVGIAAKASESDDNMLSEGGQLLYVAGKAVIGSGTVLQNNFPDDSSDTNTKKMKGIGVYVKKGATLDMTGGEIKNLLLRHTTSSIINAYGLAVYTDGIFTMTGGTITQCSFSITGSADGIVYVGSNGTFSLGKENIGGGYSGDGQIINNCFYSIVHSAGTTIFYSGSIKNNTLSNDFSYVISSFKYFYLHGGNISGNTVGECVFKITGGNMYLKGTPVIADNKISVTTPMAIFYLFSDDSQLIVEDGFAPTDGTSAINNLTFKCRTSSIDNDSPNRAIIQGADSDVNFGADLFGVDASWTTVPSNAEIVFIDGTLDISGKDTVRYRYKTHTISYRDWGGSEEQEYTGSDLQSFYYEPLGFTLPTPTKEGYSFVGWFSSPDGTEAVNAIEANETTDKIVYAKWTIESYTLDFDENGGDEVNSITRDYGTSYTALPIAGRTGYIFNGWFESEENDNGTGMQFTATIMPDLGNNGATKTLYAKWTIKSYTLDFDENGGDAVGNITQNYGTDLSLPTPEKDGYAFAGWFEEEESGNGTGTQFTATTMPNLGNNGATKTLYAKWTIESYTLIFESNGGDVIGNIDQEFGTALSLPIPEKNGYDFAGWFESEENDNGTGTQFAETTMSDLGDNGATKTLYAKWTHIHVDGIDFNKELNDFQSEITAGNYILMRDIGATDNITITGDVKLCLNGNTLNMFDRYSISFAADATLSIYDCSDIATIGTILSSNTRDPLINLNNINSKLVLYRGTIENQCASENPHPESIVLVNENSFFEMYEGTILAGGYVDYAVKAHGTFSMYGGTISASHAIRGGVYTTATLNMEGGEITSSGAGITFDDTDTSDLYPAKFNLSRGIVEGDETDILLLQKTDFWAMDGMGIYYNGSVMEIITSAYASGETVVSGVNDTTCGKFTLKNAPGFALCYDKANGTLEYSSIAATVEFGGNTASFTTFEEAWAYASDLDTTSNRATVTLLGDVDLTNAITVSSGDTITLDLGGFTIDRGLSSATDLPDDGSVITVNGNLMLTGPGTITGGVGTLSEGTRYGGGINIGNGGDFTATRVDISGNSATKGGAIYQSNGRFILDDCEIHGNSATDGGAIYNSNSTVASTISGGSIYGNSSTGTGAAVNNNTNGSLILNGASITGNDGYGLYVAPDSTSTNVYNNVTITDNHIGGTLNPDTGEYEADEDSEKANAYLSTGKTLVIGDGDSAREETFTGNIGITIQAPPSKGNPVSITSGNTSQNSGEFSSDDESIQIPTSGNGQSLVWTYVVTYDKGSYGVEDTLIVRVADGESHFFNAIKFTREGYYLDDWNKSENGDGTGYDFGYEYTDNEDITIYPQWMIETYTIDFDENGGDEVNNITREYGTSYNALPIAVRKGYTFEGWFESEENNNGTGIVFDATTMPDLGDNGDTKTLYAKWTEKATIVIAETAQASVPYNGNAIPFTITGTNSGLTFVVSYYVGDAWTEDAPIYYGNYNVKIYRAEDETYKEYEKTIVDGLVIGKGELSFDGITASDITYGQKLSASTYSAKPKNTNNNALTVAGTYTWTDTTTVYGVADPKSHEFTFVPDDTENYEVAYTDSKDVTVNRADIVITNVSATSLFYGQKLEESNITCDLANEFDSTLSMANVGSWTWVAPTTVAEYGTHSYDITFVRSSEGLANYNQPDGSTVSVTVTEGTVVFTGMPEFDYGEDWTELDCINMTATSYGTAVPGTFSFVNPGSLKPNVAMSNYTERTLRFVPDEVDNYNEIADFSTKFVVHKATVSISFTSNPTKITFGQRVANSSFTAKAISDVKGETVLGSFDWETPDVKPASTLNILPENRPAYKVVFTMNEAASNNYSLPDPSYLTYGIEVAPADVTLSVEGVKPVYYGQELSQSEILGASAKTTLFNEDITDKGTFTWVRDTYIPSVRNSNVTPFDIKFTPNPEYADSYLSRTISVTIVVNSRAIIIEVVDGASVSKTYDGGKTYDGDFILDTHYKYRINENDPSLAPAAVYEALTIDRTKVSITFSDANVATVGKTATAIIPRQSLGGIAIENYIFTQAVIEMSAEVVPAEVSVTKIDALLSKTYDASTDYAGEFLADTHYTMNGVLEDDAENVQLTPFFTFDNKNAGDRTVTATLAFSGTAGTNYTPVPATLSYDGVITVLTATVVDEAAAEDGDFYVVWEHLDDLVFSGALQKPTATLYRKGYAEYTETLVVDNGVITVAEAIEVAATSDNYSFTEAITAQFAIVPLVGANVKADEASAADGDFYLDSWTGLAVDFDAAAHGATVTLLRKGAEYASFSETLSTNEFIYVGSHTVTATSVNITFAVDTEAQATLVIGKSIVTAVAESAAVDGDYYIVWTETSLTYTREEQKPTAVLYRKGSEYADFSETLSVTGATDAGTPTSTATGVNVDFAGGNTCQFTIAPYAVSIVDSDVLDDGEGYIVWTDIGLIGEFYFVHTGAEMSPVGTLHLKIGGADVSTALTVIPKNTDICGYDLPYVGTIALSDDGNYSFTEQSVTYYILSAQDKAAKDIEAAISDLMQKAEGNNARYILAELSDEITNIDNLIDAYVATYGGREFKNIDTYNAIDAAGDFAYTYSDLWTKDTDTIAASDLVTLYVAHDEATVLLADPAYTYASEEKALIEELMASSFAKYQEASCTELDGFITDTTSYSDEGIEYNGRLIFDAKDLINAVDDKFDKATVDKIKAAACLLLGEMSSFQSNTINSTDLAPKKNAAEYKAVEQAFYPRMELLLVDPYDTDSISGKCDKIKSAADTALRFTLAKENALTEIAGKLDDLTAEQTALNGLWTAAQTTIGGYTYIENTAAEIATVMSDTQVKADAVAYIEANKGTDEAVNTEVTEAVGYVVALTTSGDTLVTDVGAIKASYDLIIAAIDDYRDRIDTAKGNAALTDDTKAKLEALYLTAITAVNGVSYDEDTALDLDVISFDVGFGEDFYDYREAAIDAVNEGAEVTGRPAYEAAVAAIQTAAIDALNALVHPTNVNANVDAAKKIFDDKLNAMNAIEAYVTASVNVIFIVDDGLTAVVDSTGSGLNDIVTVVCSKVSAVQTLEGRRDALAAPTTDATIATLKGYINDTSIANVKALPFEIISEIELAAILADEAAKEAAAKDIDAFYSDDVNGAIASEIADGIALVLDFVNDDDFTAKSAAIKAAVKATTDGIKAIENYINSLSDDIRTAANTAVAKIVALNLNSPTIATEVNAIVDAFKVQRDFIAHKERQLISIERTLEGLTPDETVYPLWIAAKETIEGYTYPKNTEDDVDEAYYNASYRSTVIEAIETEYCEDLAINEEVAEAVDMILDYPIGDSTVLYTFTETTYNTFSDIIDEIKDYRERIVTAKGNVDLTDDTKDKLEALYLAAITAVNGVSYTGTAALLTDIASNVSAGEAFYAYRETEIDAVNTAAGAETGREAYTDAVADIQTAAINALNALAHPTADSVAVDAVKAIFVTKLAALTVIENKSATYTSDVSLGVIDTALSDVVALTETGDALDEAIAEITAECQTHLEYVLYKESLITRCNVGIIDTDGNDDLTAATKEDLTAYYEATIDELEAAVYSTDDDVRTDLAAIKTDIDKAEAFYSAREGALDYVDGLTSDKSTEYGNALTLAKAEATEELEALLWDANDLTQINNVGIVINDKMSAMDESYALGEDQSTDVWVVVNGALTLIAQVDTDIDNTIVSAAAMMVIKTAATAKVNAIKALEGRCTALVSTTATTATKDTLTAYINGAIAKIKALGFGDTDDEAATAIDADEAAKEAVALEIDAFYSGVNAYIATEIAEGIELVLALDNDSDFNDNSAALKAAVKATTDGIKEIEAYINSESNDIRAAANTAVAAVAASDLESATIAMEVTAIVKTFKAQRDFIANKEAKLALIADKLAALTAEQTAIKELWTDAENAINALDYPADTETDVNAIYNDTEVKANAVAYIEANKGTDEAVNTEVTEAVGYVVALTTSGDTLGTDVGAIKASFDLIIDTIDLYRGKIVTANGNAALTDDTKAKLEALYVDAIDDVNGVSYTGTAALLADIASDVTAGEAFYTYREAAIDAVNTAGTVTGREAYTDAVAAIKTAAINALNALVHPTKVNADVDAIKAIFDAKLTALNNIEALVTASVDVTYVVDGALRAVVALVGSDTSVIESAATSMTDAIKTLEGRRDALAAPTTTATIDAIKDYINDTSIEDVKALDFVASAADDAQAILDEEEARETAAIEADGNYSDVNGAIVTEIAEAVGKILAGDLDDLDDYTAAAEAIIDAIKSLEAYKTNTRANGDIDSATEAKLVNLANSLITEICALDYLPLDYDKLNALKTVDGKTETIIAILANKNGDADVDAECDEAVNVVIDLDPESATLDADCDTIENGARIIADAIKELKGYLVVDDTAASIAVVTNAITGIRALDFSADGLEGIVDAIVEVSEDEIDFNRYKTMAEEALATLRTSAGTLSTASKQKLLSCITDADTDLAAVTFGTEFSVIDTIVSVATQKHDAVKALDATKGTLPAIDAEVDDAVALIAALDDATTLDADIASIKASEKKLVDEIMSLADYYDDVMNNAELGASDHLKSVVREIYIDALTAIGTITYTEDAPVADSAVEAIDDAFNDKLPSLWNLERAFDGIPAATSETTRTAVKAEITSAMDDIAAISGAQIADRATSVYTCCNSLVTAAYADDAKKAGCSAPAIAEIDEAITTILALAYDGNIAQSVTAIDNILNKKLDAIKDVEGYVVAADSSASKSAAATAISNIGAVTFNATDFASVIDGIVADVKANVDFNRAKEAVIAHLEEEALGRGLSQTTKTDLAAYLNHVVSSVSGIYYPELIAEVNALAAFAQSKIDGVKTLDALKTGKSGESIEELKVTISDLLALEENEALGGKITKTLATLTAEISAIETLVTFRKDVKDAATKDVLNEAITDLRELNVYTEDPEVVCQTICDTALTKAKLMLNKLDNLAALKAYVETKLATGRYNDDGKAEIAGIHADGNNAINAAATIAQSNEKLENAKKAIDDVKIYVVDGGLIGTDGNLVQEYPSERGESLYGEMFAPAGVDPTSTILIKEVPLDPEFRSKSRSSILSKKAVYFFSPAANGLDKPAEFVNGRTLTNAFDITLLINGEPAKDEQLNGTYTVTMLVPEEYRGLDMLTLVYLTDDGKVEVFNAKIDGNYMTFDTTHFGRFYTISKSPFNTIWIVVLVLAVVLLVAAAVTIIVVLQKKKKKERGPDYRSLFKNYRYFD